MKVRLIHCVKSVRIWSFSDPYFPTFELNTEIYPVNLQIKSECRKIRSRKTPDTHNFYAVTKGIFDKSRVHVGIMKTPKSMRQYLQRARLCNLNLPRFCFSWRILRILIKTNTWCLWSWKILAKQNAVSTNFAKKQKGRHFTVNGQPSFKFPAKV